MWLADAHHLAADCLGDSRQAVDHWKAYLRIRNLSGDIYRKDGIAFLKRYGINWEDE